MRTPTEAGVADGPAAGVAGPDVDLRHHGDVEVRGGGDLVDLAVNVRAGTPPAWLKSRVAASLDGLAAYPDGRAARAAVAARHGVPAERVLLTAGAAEAFVLLARALRVRRPVVVHPQFTEPEAALRDALRNRAARGVGRGEAGPVHRRVALRDVRIRVAGHDLAFPPLRQRPLVSLHVLRDADDTDLSHRLDPDPLHDLEIERVQVRMPPTYRDEPCNAIGIASVWGLTFTMVQDAVNEIPVMTFLAYRFIPASLIVALTVVVTLAGAAGMYTFENENPDGRGLSNYGAALWWTAMIMTTMGSEYWPQTAEGRVLCFLLSLYAFAVFGYAAWCEARMIRGTR